MVNEILERNLPVLNFAAYHLPKPWAERFVASAAGGIVWLKFWRRSHDPKKESKKAKQSRFDCFNFRS